ncbi:MAG: ATP-dependent zinc metalloprotease FtsH [Solirubrobacterales bacterium]|nr:ATP-dependent zinc metalloprotease FtsH [Solirubrobacterales bacterium]
MADETPGAPQTGQEPTRGENRPRGRNLRLPPPGSGSSEPPRPPGSKNGADGRSQQHPGLGNNNQNNRPPNRRTNWAVLAAVVAILIGLNMWISSQVLNSPRIRLPYNEFLSEVQQGNVATVTTDADAVQGTFKQAVADPSSNKETKNFGTQIPSFAPRTSLYDLLVKKDVQLNAQNPNSGPGIVEEIIVSFGPALLIILLVIFVMRRAAGAGAGGLMSFGRSSARRVEGDDQHVTFNDVAGIDEAKGELYEIVDFLKEPEKYLRLGAKIPRGVLLSGPPGTGKTLLARAVAGEANVPFFQMSASEFVEMIVGVGASRVRDLFNQAKEAAPAIIFIDELDAIGRSRSSGGPNLSGGHDEREQTLNQILTEMDGFDPRSGVIVLGATNRPEILDQALLRPGRFDRRVVVQPPDRVGREKVLKVHTRSVPLSPDVDLGGLASTTPGMVGADLANLVNEAALLAAKRSHEKVGKLDFTDALERIVLGAARQVVMSDADRRRTAYHEAGHAIVGMLTPGADPVRKVSIIPRGQALGVTFSAPDADRFNHDERHLMAQIKVALGGRCAEEVVFGDLTTGAESDIQQLTRIARYMVGRWGMSSAIGPVAVLASEESSFLLPGAAEASEQTQQLIDKEVHRIVDNAHREVIELLTERRASLDDLVTELLAEETLDEADAYAAAGLTRDSASGSGSDNGSVGVDGVRASSPGKPE